MMTEPEWRDWKNRAANDRLPPIEGAGIAGAVLLVLFALLLGLFITTVLTLT